MFPNIDNYDDNDVNHKRYYDIVDSDIEDEYEDEDPEGASDLGSEDEDEDLEPYSLLYFSQ